LIITRGGETSKVHLTSHEGDALGFHEVRVVSQVEGRRDDAFVCFLLVAL